MGSYFPMPNNQRDASTMFYLKDPLPASHSETPILQGNTIMYMNFASSSNLYSDANSQSHSSCVNVPSDSTTSQQEVLLNFGRSQALDNQWKEERNEMMMMQQQQQQQQQQGLSLSLSTHVPSVLFQYQNENNDFSSIMGSNPLLHGEDRGRNVNFDNEDSFQNKRSRESNNDYMLSSTATNDGPTYVNGMPSVSRGVPNSKYLKAAQELLDEAVNVKRAIKDQKGKSEVKKDSKEVEGAYDPSSSSVTQIGRAHV